MEDENFYFDKEDLYRIDMCKGTIDWLLDNGYKKIEEKDRFVFVKD